MLKGWFTFHFKDQGHTFKDFQLQTAGIMWLSCEYQVFVMCKEGTVRLFLFWTCTICAFGHFEISNESFIQHDYFPLEFQNGACYKRVDKRSSDDLLLWAGFSNPSQLIVSSILISSLFFFFLINLLSSINQ